MHIGLRRYSLLIKPTAICANVLQFTMMAFVAVVFLANFAVSTFGHPYGQFGQYSSLTSPQAAYRKPFNVYKSYPQVATSPNRQFSQLFSPVQQSPQVTSFAGIQQFKQPDQPSYGAYKSRSSCPSCSQLQEEEAEEEQFPEFGLPLRTARSIASTGIPVIEGVQMVAPPAFDSLENNDSAFMRSVRSALLALEPLFAAGEPQALWDRKAAQNEIPMGTANEVIPTSDSHTQQTQQERSPPAHGCGMYYNVRLQSISAFSNPINEEVDRKTETETEAREQKIEEQQNDILNALGELAQGQVATLMQQFDTEMMAKREFKIQELYMKEIKRILNSIKTASESRNKVASDSVPTNNEKKIVALESETMTSHSDQPDTTSAVPTSDIITTTESTTSH